MVNARTYPLWQQLAVTEGLPSEALPAVIEALCRPSTPSMASTTAVKSGVRRPPRTRCRPGPVGVWRPFQRTRRRCQVSSVPAGVTSR